MIEQQIEIDGLLQVQHSGEYAILTYQHKFPRMTSKPYILDISGERKAIVVHNYRDESTDWKWHSAFFNVLSGEKISECPGIVHFHELSQASILRDGKIVVFNTDGFCYDIESGEMFLDSPNFESKQLASVVDIGDSRYIFEEKKDVSNKIMGRYIINLNTGQRRKWHGPFRGRIKDTSDGKLLCSYNGLTDILSGEVLYDYQKLGLMGKLFVTKNDEMIAQRKNRKEFVNLKTSEEYKLLDEVHFPSYETAGGEILAIEWINGGAGNEINTSNPQKIWDIKTGKEYKSRRKLAGPIIQFCNRLLALEADVDIKSGNLFPIGNLKFNGKNLIDLESGEEIKFPLYIGGITKMEDEVIATAYNYIPYYLMGQGFFRKKSNKSLPTNIF